MGQTSRRTILLAVCMIMLIGLAGRLAWMQLVQADEYGRIANENRIRMLPIMAPRGRILDRNGVDLVRNRPSFTISVLPADYRSAESRVRLAGALGIQETELVERMRRRTGLPLEPVGIQRDADMSLIARLEERIEHFPGIIIANEPVREYPQAPWGGHVLGYVREVNDDDLKRTDKTGSPLRGSVGATGLEKKYDQSLRGIDGTSYRQINAFGQMLGEMPGYPTVFPAAGDDVILSLDIKLQHLADSLLSGHPAGTVIATDIATGEVLCLVTRPGFDANHFSGGMSSAEWNALRDDSLKPLLNRAAMGLYTAGSTAKLLTAAAGLEAAVVTPSTTFYSCHGGYRYGNRVFHCWNASGHGTQDMLGAIQNSCNVYFYQLGPKVGLDTWSRYAKEAGFGAPTGIDIPSENKGIVPTREYLDRLRGKDGWGPGAMLNFAIGQGEFTVTPLQVVMYYAALANNGVAMKPHILKASRESGRDWVPFTPEIAYNLNYKHSTLAVLQEGCRRVVQYGTAAGINDDKVLMAGKTGTAQNPHGNEHAWFAGWAPHDNPKIAVCALVENAGHGSTYAAPICFAVAKEFLYPTPPDTTTPAPIDSTQVQPGSPTASVEP